MGYTTEFDGEISIEPALNQAEIDYLYRFIDTRRMERTKGPYFVGGNGFMGQGDDPDIPDFNQSGSQPNLWCQWEPSEDGTVIRWNWAEKFYDSVEWMQYLIDHFLRPGANASWSHDPQFNNFTFDHILNGEIIAQGEEIGDLWKLTVKNNEVKKKKAKL